MRDKVRRFLSDAEAFYLGRFYPLLIAFIVLFPSLFGFEVFFYFLHATLASVGLFISKSIKPFIISLLTFHLEISIKHSPFYPSYSDYLTSGGNLALMIILFVTVLGAIFYFAVKKEVIKRAKEEKDRVTLALAPLSLVLLFNGAFSGEWEIRGLLFALALIFTYAILFIIIRYGLDYDEGIFEYISYIGVIVSAVMIIQLLLLFLSGTPIKNGSIVKESVALGWGIWNLVGGALVSYIPILFYATRYPRLKWISLPLCALAYLSCILTLSRNALLVGTLVLLLCVFIHMRTLVKRRGLVALAIAIGFLFLSVAIALAWDKISTLFLDYFNRLLSDNGRFSLWREAISDFFRAPIFGVGFYGYTPDTATFGALPKMAHNFVLEFLCASGIFAPIAFGFWIFESARAIFKVGDSGRLILSLTPLSVLVGSLLDNFVFYIYPMFIYNVILAIITKNAKKEKTL